MTGKPKAANRPLAFAAYPTAIKGAFEGTRSITVQK